MQKISARIAARTAGTKSDWKDSRLVIAALTAAGTATFMGTVVLPITMSAQSAKIELLTSKLDELGDTKDRLEALNKELAEARLNISQKEILVAQLMAQTPFLPGSPYPSGADKIILGTTKRELLQMHPDGKWNDDEEESYYSVDPKHPHFSSITYYIDSPKNERISHILYHINHKSPLTHTELKLRFKSIWGHPHAERKNGDSWWKISQRESVEIRSNNTYAVSSSTYNPYMK